MRAKWLLQPDDLANWFLRLNGCLTLVNFIVHGRRDRKPGEFDILAARFPDRHEIYGPGVEFVDHPKLRGDGRIDLIIAETTRSACKLNGPWTEENGRLRYVIQAIGPFAPPEVDDVARGLYAERRFIRHERYRVRVFAFGRETDPGLGDNVEQFTWAQVLAFIYDRFDAHRAAKMYHEPWGKVGDDLWTASEQHDVHAFVREGIRALGVPNEYAGPHMDRGLR